MSQRDIIAALVRSGNPWLDRSRIAALLPSGNNVGVSISRLADMLETRPSLAHPNRNEYRLRPRCYSELCPAYGTVPAEDGLKPFSLSAHLNGRVNGHYDSSPDNRAGTEIWEEDRYGIQGD